MTHEDVNELVQASRAYFIRSDLTQLDRQSLAAGERLARALDKFAEPLDVRQESAA